MPTNIIQSFITNTNFITMPAEVTNSILKVAELPAKPWWEIALMIGAPTLTALSAWLMWRSVEEMKRQTDISLVIDIYTKLQDHFNTVIESSDIAQQIHVIKHGRLCLKAAVLYYYAITSKKSKFLFDNVLKIFFESFIDDYKKHNLGEKLKIPPEILRYCQEHGIEIPKDQTKDTPNDSH